MEFSNERESMTNPAWCKPVVYDLTRSARRTSVPKDVTLDVPELPGVYAICRVGAGGVFEAILDIGECGLRPRSSPRGLRGRLASGVAHSASERIAADVSCGRLQGGLHVVWLEAESKEFAKEVQDALLTLFVRECGMQPKYNEKPEHHKSPERFESIYHQLKAVAGCGT